MFFQAQKSTKIDHNKRQWRRYDWGDSQALFCNSAEHDYSINDHTTEFWRTADNKSQGNTPAWEELCYAAGQNCLYLF